MSKLPRTLARTISRRRWLTARCRRTSRSATMTRRWSRCSTITGWWSRQAGTSRVSRRSAMRHRHARLRDHDSRPLAHRQHTFPSRGTPRDVGRAPVLGVRRDEPRTGRRRHGIVDQAADPHAPALVVLVAAMTWIVVGRALRPVERIRTEVDRIQGSGGLDRRVSSSSAHDEIGRLATTMNGMLAGTSSVPVLTSASSSPTRATNCAARSPGCAASSRSTSRTRRRRACHR